MKCICWDLGGVGARRWVTSNQRALHWWSRLKWAAFHNKSTWWARHLCLTHFLNTWGTYICNMQELHITVNTLNKLSLRALLYEWFLPNKQLTSHQCMFTSRFKCRTDGETPNKRQHLFFLYLVKYGEKVVRFCNGYTSTSVMTKRHLITHGVSGLCIYRTGNVDF